jgi:hypothetical protein
MRAGGGDSGFVPADGIRADFDKFAARRFLIGSESQLVEQIGRYGEEDRHRPHLLRRAMAGLGQKMVVRTLERLAAWRSIELTCDPDSVSRTAAMEMIGNDGPVRDHGELPRDGGG